MEVQLDKLAINYSYADLDWLQVFRMLAAFSFGIAFGVILVHYAHAQVVDPILHGLNNGNGNNGSLFTVDYGISPKKYCAGNLTGLEKEFCACDTEPTEYKGYACGEKVIG